MIKRKIKIIIIYLINLIIKKIKIFPDQISKKHKIKFKNEEIYFVPKNDITYRRWKEFERTGKEKNTIEWIETFERNSVFFDIGANVGVFSIFAALKKEAKVYAFEPEPNSFVELFNAIQVNNVDVTAMIIPLEEKANCNFFNLKAKFEAGKSGHIFGDKQLGKLNYGICSESIDNLVLNKKIPEPNYIKIDVDGLEEKIMNGLDKLIKGNVLRSILIEFMHEEQNKSCTKYLENNNFFLTQGPTGDNRNYIFSRKK
jgi:FkbM family methyltransferase